MAKMCPMSGCKNDGMCVHDKMMIAMGVMMMIGLVGVVLHWSLHAI